MAYPNHKTTTVIILLFLFICRLPLPASENGYWTKLIVKAYQPQQNKYLDRYSNGIT
jgi:hypothetical protein